MGQSRFAIATWEGQSRHHWCFLAAPSALRIANVCGKKSQHSPASRLLLDVSLGRASSTMWSRMVWTRFCPLLPQSPFSCLTSARIVLNSLQTSLGLIFAVIP